MKPKGHSVGQEFSKVDGMHLVTGKPAYTDDLAPKDCLIIKILRRFELDYFVKMIVSNNLESKKEITSIESNNNFNLEELLNKIEIEESKVTGKIKYYLNISEKELENLKQNAR